MLLFDTSCTREFVLGSSFPFILAQISTSDAPPPEVFSI